MEVLHPLTEFFMKGLSEAYRVHWAASKFMRTAVDTATSNTV